MRERKPMNEKKDPAPMSALRSMGRALAHLGAIWNDASLWDEAEALLDRLPESIEQDQSFDVISGSVAFFLKIGLHAWSSGMPFANAAKQSFNIGRRQSLRGGVLRQKDRTNDN